MQRMENMMTRTQARRAFTLIELLVVIAIIALLVGILLPALGKARNAARLGVCLSNCRQMSVVMMMYGRDSKDWYPVPPGSQTTPYLNNVYRYGGVAGLFSLYQLGDSQYFPTGDGYTGTTGDPATAAYSDGNTNPLLSAYMDGFGALYCPSDKEDIYFGRVPSTSGSITASLAAGGLKVPHAPKSSEDVVSYNISYLYIAGMKTDEAVVVKPAPIWGDETNGPDISVAAWYGGGSGSTSPNATAARTMPGYYGPEDNHGHDGANFTFTDGHAAFLTGNIQETFFSTSNRAGQSVNVIDPHRSDKTQTMD